MYARFAGSAGGYSVIEIARTHSAHPGYQLLL